MYSGAQWRDEILNFFLTIVTRKLSQENLIKTIPDIVGIFPASTEVLFKREFKAAHWLKKDLRNLSCT